MSDQQMQSRAPYAVSEPRLTVSGQMVTTAFEIPGFRVKQNLGVVRGIVVRSRNVFVNIGAVLNQLVGGNITAWSNLCETARRDAFDIMIQHATEIGANAIIGARYDATEIATGVTEVLAYGTAVVVQPTEGTGIYGSVATRGLCPTNSRGRAEPRRQVPSPPRPGFRSLGRRGARCG